MKPIGFVETKASGDQVRYKDNISKIILNSDLEQALEGVEDFSHLFILYWLHEISRKTEECLKTHPRGRKDMPLLGIFATRTPHRPNPIGLTLVELLKVNGCMLTACGALWFGASWSHSHSYMRRVHKGGHVPGLLS